LSGPSSAGGPVLTTTVCSSLRATSSQNRPSNHSSQPLIQNTSGAGIGMLPALTARTVNVIGEASTS
jgi:hypothetical protein